MRVAPRAVILDRPFLSPHSLNWTNIPDFTTTLLDVDQILEILRLGPNLTKLHFDLISSRDALSPDEAYKHVVHPNIEFLDIGILSLMNLFFTSITLPSLDDLTLRGDCEHLPTEPLIEFFECSINYLKNLSLDDWVLTIEDAIVMAKAIPSSSDRCRRRTHIDRATTSTASNLLVVWR
ncbi:hypothetical protein CPB84DRAFT_1851686 [Gymnopilus junonius]|uniref:Uncharacterized protein n=1 Tax=Gymnopilus junonius TaxID=109634 RepID=A0A9P5NCV8_GYMJU|nr:hypothetical protein CPB84DRAFT_1851686 [Gymnopilus junonius]